MTENYKLDLCIFRSSNIMRVLPPTQTPIGHVALYLPPPLPPSPPRDELQECLCGRLAYSA